MTIYADNAATTRMSGIAIQAMTEAMKHCWGNPSSAHGYGDRASKELEYARKTIAQCINAWPEEIYFTSGGTEADNWACIIGANHEVPDGFPRLSAGVLTSNIEHKAILANVDYENKMRWHEVDGDASYFLEADENGLVSGFDINKHTDFKTATMVSVMLANNEIGTIQPIQDIAKVCNDLDVLFHTDAVQAVGHIPVDVDDLGVDMLSASGHKFHGPKGVGFLYVRNGTPMLPLHYGGGQERGLRSGTENVPGIVGMAAALEESCEHMAENISRTTAMRDRLIAGLLQIPDSALNGSRDYRLPGNINVRFDGIDGGALVVMLDRCGIAVSTGSACTTGDLATSHVLKAIGLTNEQAAGSIRITLDHYNTEPEVDYILKSVSECVEMLRKMRV